MSRVRSALYPLRLVRARLGKWSGAVVLVVLGIAAGASVVVGGRAGSVVAQDRAVAQAVERIPDGSRSVRAVWFGIPAQSPEPQPVLERRARAALRHAVDADARALVLFRESTIGGTFAGLGGVQGLGSQVALRSGRLPLECRPERCEVLRLRGVAGRIPEPEGLTLVEVGTGALKSRLLFGDFLAPTDNALAEAEVSPSLARSAGYHRPPPPPLFLAEGVRTLAGAPALDVVFRSYAWVAPLEAGRPRLWQVDDLATGVARARSELQSVTSSFDLIAPVEELREAQATSRAAGRRLGIVGGEAAALLFAFALLAAMTLRTDLAAARRRLAWYGARGWQLALLTVAESAALALVGTVVGLAVGALGGAFVAHRAGAPVGEILARSTFSAQGLGLALLVAVAATGVLVAAVAARSPRLAPARFSLVDAAAVAAVLVVALELWRGDGDGDLVLLLPALVTFAAAVFVGRLLRPVLRVAERLSRGRSLGLRLASLSLSRNPGYAVVATAFLVVSFGLALFAESYRATLARGERDQAAHRVPLDYVVREDLRRLIPVQDAASLARFRELGVNVAPVLRVTGGVGRLEGESGITLLGLPPETLPVLHGWRDSDAAVTRQELVRRIDAGRPLKGLRLPDELKRLRVTTRSDDKIRLFAEIEAPNGRFVRVAPERHSFHWRRAAAASRESCSSRTRGSRSVVPTQAGRLKGSVEIALPDLPGALNGWVGVGGARIDGTKVGLHVVELGRDPGSPAPAVRRRAGAGARDAAACGGGGFRRLAPAADRAASASRYGSSAPCGGSPASTARRWSATATRSRRSSTWRGPERRA